MDEYRGSIVLIWNMMDGKKGIIVLTWSMNEGNMDNFNRTNLLEIVVGLEVFAKETLSKVEMAKAKVSATDVRESSSDSSEAGNRWRKSDSQSKPINGNDESLNEAFLGAHSIGINLHRYLEENRLLGEVELVGCLSEEDAGSISPKGDCSDFYVDLSQNLNNTKWVDIVSKGLGVCEPDPPLIDPCNSRAVDEMSQMCEPGSFLE
ncbi:hypothetical protein GQ457_11G030670 [Hibiscus cannabinus]